MELEGIKQTMSTQSPASGLYHRKTVSSLSDLSPGDHIRVDRGVYHHHMMVVEVVSADAVTVIHYTGVEELEERAAR